MNREQFAALYNPLNRCLATYVNGKGETITAVLLDAVQTSTTGAEFVYLDSFANRMPLAELQSVKDTGTAWVAK